MGVSVKLLIGSRSPFFSCGVHMYATSENRRAFRASKSSPAFQRLCETDPQQGRDDVLHFLWVGEWILNHSAFKAWTRAKPYLSDSIRATCWVGDPGQGKTYTMDVSPHSTLRMHFGSCSRRPGFLDLDRLDEGSMDESHSGALP